MTAIYDSLFLLALASPVLLSIGLAMVRMSRTAAGSRTGALLLGLAVVGGSYGVLAVLVFGEERFIRHPVRRGVRD